MTGSPKYSVETMVAREFPSRGNEAIAVLARYQGPEPDRVKTCAIKLAEGDLGELEQLITMARVDYRDVIAYVEYPHQILLPTNATESQRLDAEQLDRKQFEDWLSG
ncbi:MAG: hypothetical protein AAFV77_00255 [Planctomycetota bacterium]